MSSKQLGLFWEPEEKKTTGGPIRSMPKIKSKWRHLPPDRWPNYRHAKTISIDTETYDPDLLTSGPGWARSIGEIVGISCSVGRNDSVYLPMRHKIQAKRNCDPQKVLMWAKDNLQNYTNNKRKVLGANLLYDIGWLRQEGVHVGGKFIDIQIVEKLIDENQLSYSLEAISQQYLKQGKVSKKLYKWLARYYGGKINGSQRKNIYRAPASLVGPYAEADAWQPFQIWKKQKTIIKTQGLDKVLDLECDFMKVLLDIRFRGVRIDIKYAEEMRERLILVEAKLQQELDYIAGRHIRYNAPASIAKGFDSLGLGYERTEAGNPSFTKILLKGCGHKIASKILEIREVNKLRSTFVENALLNKHINGIVYGTFKQLGTRSGRLSAEYPNLQQAPSRTELGKELRKCFIPDEDKTHWYRADVSQIQYRGLANHAVGKGSDALRERYRNDPKTDFHLDTQVKIKQITKIVLDRKHTKNINFGLMFGMMKKKLIKTLNVSDKKGNKFFDAYHLGVPFVQSTFDYFSELAQQRGYITTILGRRSRFEQWCEPYGKEYFDNRSEAVQRFGYDVERAFTYKALVMLVQGEEADFMKGAMVKCHKDGIFDSIGGVPSLIVHDEIDGSCNINEDKEALMHMRDVMQDSSSLNIPILIDLEVGKNWRDCKKL